MVMAETTIKGVTTIANIPRGAEWIQSNIIRNNYHKIIITLERICKGLCNGMADLEIRAELDIV